MSTICLFKSIVVLQFADDMKMFHVIQSAQDFLELQDDINRATGLGQQVAT